MSRTFAMMALGLALALAGNDAKAETVKFQQSPLVFDAPPGFSIFDEKSRMIRREGGGSAFLETVEVGELSQKPEFLKRLSCKGLADTYRTPKALKLKRPGSYQAVIAETPQAKDPTRPNSPGFCGGIVFSNGKQLAVALFTVGFNSETKQDRRADLLHFLETVKIAE